MSRLQLPAAIFLCAQTQSVTQYPTNVNALMLAGPTASYTPIYAVAASELVGTQNGVITLVAQIARAAS